MKIKEETPEQILLENAGRFFALINVYERSLKLIDSKNDEEKLLQTDITAREAMTKIANMDSEDFSKEMQEGQEKLFFLEESP